MPAIGRTTAVNAYREPAARDLVRGRVSFDWLEGGAFLAMRAAVQWPGPSGAVAVIGRDDAAETYSILYFDARGRWTPTNLPRRPDGQAVVLGWSLTIRERAPP